jgi:polyisoprenoid-binding protein YceI
VFPPIGTPSLRARVIARVVPRGNPSTRRDWQVKAARHRSDRHYVEAILHKAWIWSTIGCGSQDFRLSRSNTWSEMGTWQLDPYHTQVEFSAKHLGMMTVRGHFAEVSATGEIHPDRPEASTVQATISTASIRTNHEVRDNDLRTSNFLDVENYPVMTFTSTSIEPAGEDQYKVTGDLTIKGTTHAVTLDLRRYGEFNDPMMGHRIAYGATTQINRKDFGLSFSMVLDGRFVVSEEIQISIEGELVEQQEEATTEAAT